MARHVDCWCSVVLNLFLTLLLNLKIPDFIKSIEMLPILLWRHSWKWLSLRIRMAQLIFGIRQQVKRFELWLQSTAVRYCINWSCLFTIFVEFVFPFGFLLVVADSASSFFWVSSLLTSYLIFRFCLWRFCNLSVCLPRLPELSDSCNTTTQKHHGQSWHC
jgi:hypothetical protein